MVTQETIFDRLVMRNHDFDAFLKKNILGGKMGPAATLAPEGLGPQDQTKKLATGWKFWVNRYLKSILKNLGPEPPFKCYNLLVIICWYLFNLG